MRIVLFISSVWGGGAERAISVLANHWAARGEAVALVTFERSSSDYALDSHIERVSLEMSDTSTGLLEALRNNWRRVRAIRSVLRSSRPAVIVSFEERMNCLVVLAGIGTGIRRVISERTDPRAHKVAMVWAVLRRLSYPFAHALVVQTEAVRSWAHRVALSRARVHVIPNAVRCMRAFEHSGKAPDDPAGPSVVAVGRLIRAKGFDLLIGAFAALAREFPGWRLVIAGEGEEGASLAALARSLDVADRVHFTGWLAEPGTLLKAARLYVLPSRYEGFPNALLEAMACGLPVVATACAGASEIVSDGVNGLLVPVESQAELANAMRRLMMDSTLCQRLGERAHAASRRYEVETIVGKWDEILAPGVPSRSALLQDLQK